MKKFFVFCGGKPEEKSAEHIIPKWLIEITGDPKRKAYFGYRYEPNKQPQRRTFSFDSFRFPSCVSCNQKYSVLETNTKSVIEKMLVSGSLSASDLNLLLDWFDKIRIGLWLGYQYLDKNRAGITPKFYIEKRIGANDRMLAIFKADTDGKGLTYFGCDMPSFTYTPCCFSIRINNLFFLNMSYNDLFSRRIGFPYPKESFAMPGQQELDVFSSGRNRVMTPLLKKRFTIKGTEIYQPMFRYRISEPKVRGYYDTQYVRENSMVWEEGIGKISVQDNAELREYPGSPSRGYIPSTLYPLNPLWFRIQIQTLEWQLYIDDLAPLIRKLPTQEKRRLSNQRRLVKKTNNELLRVLLGRAEDFNR